MFNAIRVRVYPTPSQEKILAKVFGCYRFVYNKALALKEDTYKTDGKSLNNSELQKYFHSTMVIEHDFLQEFNSNILKGALMVLDQTFKRFFKKTSGYPKFKSKYSKQAVKFFTPTCISRTNLDDGKLNLTKNLKGLKFRTSKEDTEKLFQYKDYIKNITISKERNGHYFAAILIDTPDTVIKPLAPPLNVIQGFDLGIKTLLVGSKDTTFENLHFHKKSEKKLKRLQRQLARKTKGSHNREKARIKLARGYEKITNQKINYIHNMTAKIISENQTIVLEDLHVQGMLKNHGLAKAIQELSLFEIRWQVEYKAQKYGRDVIFINRFFPSSKKCSHCHSIHQNLKLADRLFICPTCGFTLDRDQNASINIEVEGLRILNEKLGSWRAENTLAETPLMEASTLVAASYVSENQELS